jgi:hypothetical protein
VTQKVFAHVGICLLGTAAFMPPLATSADAKAGPVVIRGIPSTAPASAELRLAYLVSFPNGSLEPSVDKLNAGAIQAGDTGISDSNPILEKRPGEIFVSISRPVGLNDEIIPAMGVWATPVDFGPGSVSRISATFIAPVGPIPGGGFAIGVNAKTGNKDDLATDTRMAATVNVRPGFVVRFGVPFGSVLPARVPVPDGLRDTMFSATDPQPFTIELTIDRKAGKGLAKLIVIDQVLSVPFDLSDFLADSGPAITAVGPGIAVNPNAPGQTASVHVREFRIYTKVGE